MTHIRLPSSCGLVVAPIQKDTDSKGSVRIKKKSNYKTDMTRYLGGKYLFFVSSRSVKMRGFSFLSLYKSVFIFQLLNVKMYNYGKQNTIVNFIIKKLKKTQFPQKV